MIYALTPYRVSIENERFILQVFGEDEVQALARILARNGKDFSVARDNPEQKVSSQESSRP